MTTLWGNDNGGGGANGHRVIVDYTISQDILGNYTTITWSYGVDYADPNYWNNIRNRSIAWTLTVGASVSGISGSGAGTSDATVINTSDPGYGGQIHYFYSGVVRIYHNGSGAGTIHLNASMRFSNTYDSVINQDIALPAIPQNPVAPSSVTATRVSDTQQTVAWTNNSSGTAPYASVKVYRAVDAGGFALIATLGAAATSYSDTGTSANHKYQYKVSAVGTNTVESSQTAAASPVWTTPAAASSCVATKQSNGDIIVSWVNNVGYSEYSIDIYQSTNGGSSWAYWDSATAGTTSKTHTAPSTATTHMYRVLAFTNAATPQLFAAYSNNSNNITLLATAAAPTGLAPAGVALDAAEAIVFTWNHNPTDGTPQTKYQLQWSTNGGSSWTTVGPTTSGVPSYTLPAGTTTNGQTITWRVATAGQNGTIGANSSNSVFTTSARPTSTISTPSGGTYTTSILTANWTYFQAQGSAQTSWHAYLYRDNGGGSYTVLEEKTGTTESSVTFAYTMSNATAYAVRVYVTSAAGLTSIDSGTELESFTTSFLPPASVSLSAAYQWDTGWTIVTVVGTSPVGGVSVAIATVDLQRQIDGGEWVTWAKDLVLPVSDLTINVKDTAPIVNGDNNYRAIVKSATPSSAISSTVLVTATETLWGFLSTGPGFATVARMRARLSIQAAVGRDKATYHFAGREKPVELSGEALTRRLSVLATLFAPSQGGWSSEPEDLEEIAETDGIVLWRDHRGRRIYASLSDVNINYETQANKFPVAFTLTEVDYDEDLG